MARIYRFGDFRLDPATRELWRGDAAVAVPPRAFDCIVYLLEHRERAVGRDELIAAVWGRTETGDGTLGQTVLAARRALDDTGKEQHVIRTVFRFGYHWVAEVEVADETASESSPTPADAQLAREDERMPLAPASVPASTRVPRASRQSWLLTGIAVVALVALAFVVALRMRNSGAPPQSSMSTNATAGVVAMVLPVTVSAGDGFDWVRLGLMDLIGARLRAAGLPVMPSDNVVALTGRVAQGGEPGADPAALARATGATLVIDARAEYVGGRWRTTLRTIWGREPALLAIGESADVLVAARIAADRIAQQLGYAPLRDPSADSDQAGLASLSQQVEAAMLTDRLDTARALIASAPPEQQQHAEIRLRLAQLDYQAGDFDAAESGFSAVAAAVSAEQDPVLHARAITNLGVLAAIRDNNPLAKQRLDEAIALLRRQHAPDALGKALNARANVAGQSDDYDAALQDFAEARIAFESSGNVLALAVLESNLGALDMRRLRYAEAEPVFERAAGRFATFGVNAAELNALMGAAELKVALLEPDAALAMEPRLRELIALVADPARKRNGELTRIEALAANGRLREAEASLRTVLDAAAAANDRAALARGHALSARLAFEHGDMRSAAAEAEAALQRFTPADDAREHARTARLRVRALLANGHTGDAASTLAGLSDFAAQDGSAAARYYFHLAAAESTESDDENATDKAYAQALTEADASRIPLDLREVAAAYSAWLMQKGEPARAGATAERVAGWAARDYESALVQLRVQRALGNAELWRSALTRVRALAGERVIPVELMGVPPSS